MTKLWYCDTTRY